MAVMIVEPHDGYATWLAGTLTGLTDRVVRAAGPDEAMAALAAEGQAVLGVIVGPTLADAEALGLAGRLQQGAPDVSVLLVRRHESGDLLREALRVGVKDVLPSASDEATVRAAAVRALEIARALRGRLTGGAPREAGEQRPPGKVVTVFSSKGGCGKTFLATNLAVALSSGGTEVALVDLDLHFGDVAIMLQLFPSHTIHDAAQTAQTSQLDPLSLKSFLTHHESGIWALVAPTEPTVADTIGAGAVATILKLLREAFAYVVIDTPAAFSEPVLAAFDESDLIVMLATLDVPSVKNLKLAMQTMELLHYPRNRIRTVINRADSKVGLRLPDVEKVLGSRVDVTIPSSRTVPLSVNKGHPILLEEPKAAVAQAVRRVAGQLTESGKPPSRSKQRRSLFARP
jgi:pilus assembly protein CpaE